MKNLLKASAAAVVALGLASSANAVVLAGTYYGGGASAVYKTVLTAMIGPVTGANECGTGTAYAAAGPIDVWENTTASAVVAGPFASAAAMFAGAAGSGGGSVFAITCGGTDSVPNAVAALTLNYDSTGGSWKGLGIFAGIFTNAGVASPNALTGIRIPNANPITNGSNCPISAASAEVAGMIYYHACGSTFGNPGGEDAVHNLNAAITALDFGFSDVETSLFLGKDVNQPVANSFSPTWQYNYILGTGNWGLDKTFSADVVPANETTTQVFGITFGVAASQDLFQRMQTDQNNAGTLPGGAACIGVYPPTSHACAPSITRAHMRSILSATQGHYLGQASISQLFTNTWPTDLNLVVARRDQGSGTQATSNNYFLNLGCGNATQESPDLVTGYPLISKVGVSGNATGTYIFQYNLSTGNVTTALKTANLLNTTNPPVTPPVAENLTTNGIGVVSAEKDGSSVNVAGGPAFLTLDGVYPSNVNAAQGLYGFVSEETFHILTANLSNAQYATLNTDLVAMAKLYAGPGVVPISTAAAVGSWPSVAPDANGNPTQSYFQNSGKNCGAWRSY